MYKAKESGRNTLRFFDAQMAESIKARVDLENELQSALEKQQFVMFYQLQGDADGRPIGVESIPFEVLCPPYDLSLWLRKPD